MSKAISRIAGALLVAWAAAAAMPAIAQQPYSDAEVKSVDRAALRVVLKTAEIPNIDMPPMTMPFVVREARLLDNLKPGDRVRIRAINDAGKFTLTEIVRAK